MKVLLLRNDYIGDLVLTSSVFREIKKKHPKVKLVALVSKANKDIITHNHYVDEIWVSTPFWRTRTISSIFEYLHILAKIRKEEFDIGIDIKSSWLNKIFYLYFGRVTKRVSYYYHPMNKTSRFLTDTIGFDDKIHASQSDLNLVNLALDMNSKNSWPDIHVDETDRNNVTSFLRQNGMKENKFVCVCPDASSEKKQWSLNNYSAVIAHISRKYPNHKIVLVGADQNKMLALTLFCQTADIVWFTNHNLREVYLLMQKSSVVIAQDGGPMHLAWAGNSKLVALIPDYLSLKHIGPLGKNSHIIYKPMKDISIKEVTKKIDEVLNGEK